MIHWKYIKGLNQAGSNTDLYTFLIFKEKSNNNLKHFDNMPGIYINTANALGDNSVGHIITQAAEGQHIDTPFSFHNTLNVTDAVDFDSTLNVDGAVALKSTLDVDSKTTIGGDIEVKEHWIWAPSKNFHLTATGNDQEWSFDIGYQSTSYTGSYVQFWSSKNGQTIARFNNDDSSVQIPNGKCEAVYFNATSDKRAKTNLKPLSINALDLINRVQLYSFKYKDSDLPSIGILAQDVQDVNIEGFDLVDNKQASGVDMDYMSIHESKLTYILWKAIQEQQKEIKELKVQIKNLTK